MTRRIVHAFALGLHLHAVADDGTLWCWGTIGEGEGWKQSPPLPDIKEDFSADIPF